MLRASQPHKPDAEVQIRFIEGHLGPRRAAEEEANEVLKEEPDNVKALFRHVTKFRSRGL
eukprot:5769235-Amphidinium_carterae.2